LHDLEVEHREVEGKAKSNWVAGSKFLVCNSGGLVIMLEGSFSQLWEAFFGCVFSYISIVITNHFEEKCL